MKPRALVVLNPAARHGTGTARYAAVSGLLEQRFDLRLVRLDETWRGSVRDAVQQGLDLVIAAGGDGTVGAVASALLDCPGTEAVPFGAVGLGSSNDYHKPFGIVHEGVPLRIDVAGARPRDVGRAVFSADADAAQERTFLVSASVGVTARANALFNEGRASLFAFLKRHFVDGAVLYAALAALRRHVDVAGLVRVDGEEGRYPISNLSVLKTPYLSGCLHYDTPVAPDSGLLAANLCHGMSRTALVATLLGLVRGRFCGRRQTRHWMARRVEVELRKAVPLELDGEVVLARHVQFDVPRRILACA